MRFTIVIAVAVCLSSVCLADSDLTISGEAQLGSNYLDFEASNGSFTPAPGYGMFQVTAVQSGSVFDTAGVGTGSTGSVQSLDEGAGPVTLPSAFITLTGTSSTISLTATDISAGSVGPFTLEDTSAGATATFDVIGYVGSDTSETFDARFQMLFPGVTAANLFTTSILPLDEPFCADIVIGSAAPGACLSPSTPPPSTPEPASESLVAAGFLGVAFSLLHRRLLGKNESSRI